MNLLKKTKMEYKSLAEKLRNATSPDDEPEKMEYNEELYFLFKANDSKGVIELMKEISSFYHRCYLGYENLLETISCSTSELKMHAENADDLFGTRNYGEEKGNIEKFILNSI